LGRAEIADSSSTPRKVPPSDTGISWRHQPRKIKEEMRLVIKLDKALMRGFAVKYSSRDITNAVENPDISK